MTENEGRARALIEEQVRAWCASDAAAVADAFSDPCFFMAPGLLAETPEAVRKAAAGYFKEFRDTVVVVQRMIVQGDTACVEWDWTHTDRVTGARSTSQDAVVVELQGDKIAYWREYIDSVPVDPTSVWTRHTE